MKDENGNYISPEEFIPIAEQNGMIYAIGEFVFESVCRFLRERQVLSPQGLGLSYMELNLSPSQMLFPDLSARFAAIAGRYGISPGQLNLEVTERQALADEGSLRDGAHRFTEQDFNLSMDDYGIGLSNIERLLANEYTNVKIDKSLLWKAPESAAARVMLESLIRSVRELDFNVVQEGVETAEQLHYAVGLGANLIQGYYYSKPLPEDEFVEYVRRCNAEAHQELS